jgi:urease accessory protein
MPVRLLLLLDSRSPAGAHSHSSGMESAVARGWVHTADDVEAFCRGRLLTTGRVGAAFAAYACRLWLADAGPRAWTELDSAFSARTPSEATRAASRTLGSGLHRLLRSTVAESAVLTAHSWSGCPRPAPHQPLVLGAAAALTGGDPVLAARAGALMSCTGPASAAVRLLGLDPYAVHRVTAELSADIEAIADEAARAAASATDPSELPADSAPALDLLADVHARMEVRLFAS